MSISIILYLPTYRYFFFFNDTATTEIYTLSLHDALPIYPWLRGEKRLVGELIERRTPVLGVCFGAELIAGAAGAAVRRSEEHTSEPQSRQYLVCRLLLEKKKKSYVCRKIDKCGTGIVDSD